MDSTLPRRLARSLAAAALAAAALPAFALNHEASVAPIATPRFNVSCSNVEHDMARLASLGGVPSDYWEGHEINGSVRYVTDVLAHPESAVIFTATAPFKPLMYPQTFGRKVTYAAIVCFPTSKANNDPSYTLPGDGGVVPHMQPAGTQPAIIPAQEYATTMGLPVPNAGATVQLPMIVYSHGLGGSPLGKGYLDVAVGLASQGYVVAGIFHADNRFSKVRIEDLADLAYALGFFPAVLEMMAQRPLGLKAMTDTLLASGRYAASIDRDRIGGFGASLGGQAMLNLLGARITSSLVGGCDQTEQDPRIRAAVGYVPYAGQTFLPAFCGGQEGAAGVDRPFLAISGTDDTTAPIGMAQQAINRFQNTRYLVKLVGGKHELRPQDAGDVVTWTVTFLNAYLAVPGDAAMARLIRMENVGGGGDDHLTVDVHLPAAQPARATEFLQSATGRYALALGEAEAAAKAATPGYEFARHGFLASSGAAGEVPVCRSEVQGMPMIAVGEVACGAASRARGAGNAQAPFYILPVATDGTCAAGLLQVMQLTEPLSANRFAPLPATRLTTSDSTTADMQRVGWRLQGTVGCSRP